MSAYRSSKIRNDFLESLRSLIKTKGGDVNAAADLVGVNPRTLRKWLTGKTKPKPMTMYRCSQIMRDTDVTMFTGPTLTDISRLIRTWSGIPYPPDYQVAVLTATILLVDTVKKILPGVFHAYQVYTVEADIPQGVGILKGESNHIELQFLVSANPGVGLMIKLVYTSPSFPDERVLLLPYEGNTVWKIRNVIKPLMENHVTTSTKNR